MKILYVEDETWMRRTVEVLLENAGYEFDSAVCGKDAIDLAKKNSYDLILLDIMLPDIDGYEVIDRLRNEGIETPFLVQTGIVDRTKKNQAASLGVSEYLIKPFSRAEMIERIERVVNGPEASTAESPAGPGDGRWSSKVENRQHRRFPTLKSAWVMGEDVFDCVILNMSYGGAALRLPTSERKLAPKFALQFDGSPELKCEVCWRVGNKVGVRFV